MNCHHDKLNKCSIVLLEGFAEGAFCTSPSWDGSLGPAIQSGAGGEGGNSEVLSKGKGRERCFALIAFL